MVKRKEINEKQDTWGRCRREESLTDWIQYFNPIQVFWGDVIVEYHPYLQEKLDHSLGPYKGCFGESVRLDEDIGEFAGVRIKSKGDFFLRAKCCICKNLVWVWDSSGRWGLPLCNRCYEDLPSKHIPWEKLYEN